MLKTPSYRKALSFYLQHPRAFGIQKYESGVTAGLIQPTVPSKIKVNGKEYQRGYVGHHNKRTAKRLAKSFRKSGHKAVIRKIKGGWHVYVKFDMRKLR